MAGNIVAPTTRGETEDGSARSSASYRRAGLALLLVALAFLVVQLVLVPRPFGLSSDRRTIRPR